ncbi:hypothetical protein [Paraburkholderia diazotrophica]|uniref:hypothetical protein n=1 Tax=Paraburkholderia diazotrophica TaxID=667676 RepID=UPI00317556BC
MEDHLRVLKRTLETNANAISVFGGRLAVLYKFVDAVLPLLATSQRKEVTHRFRQGIEDALSFGDDLPLPAEYQEALLNQTNVLLIALQAEGAMPN